MLQITKNEQSLTAGYSSASLSFWRFVDTGHDSDEYLKVEAYDGSTWSTIYHWSDNLGGDDGTWHQETYDLAQYLGASGFKIRFVTQQSSTGEDVQLDDVTITAVPGTAPPPEPPPVTTAPLSDGFESGLGLWRQSGDSNWIASAPSPTIPGSPAGNTVAFSSNCDSTCVMRLASPLDLSGYQSATLDLWRFVDRNLDSGEYLKVEVYDGSSWTTAFDWSVANGEDDDMWHSESYEIPAGHLVSGFDIRITARSSTPSEVAMVDDISITPVADGGASYAIYVTSEDTGSIHRYMPNGTYVDLFVNSRAGGLGEPWGLAFDSAGYLYVSDTANDKIMRYDQSGRPAGASSTNATWATTLSEPYGMAWHDGHLFVASFYGVERFNSAGGSLGYYGHATNTPPPTISRIFQAHDVAFGTNDRMYVGMLYPYKIFEYLASNGLYAGRLSTSDAELTYTNGLAWDPVADALLAAGDNPGRVIRINTGTDDVYSSATYIDAPYGIGVADDGVIYVAVKDDDSVTVINGTSISRLFPSRANGMDDPRDVAIGPGAPPGTSGASGAGGASGAAGAEHQNSEPEFELYMPDGTPIRVIEMNQSGTLSLAVNGTDADGDTISYRLDPAFDIITLTQGGAPNSAMLHINATGAAPGAYSFKIIANDGTEDEWTGYVVLIAEEET